MDFGMGGIHDTSLNALVSACDNLERLGLRGCYSVGSALRLSSDTLTEVNAQVGEAQRVTPALACTAHAAALVDRPPEHQP